MKIKLSELNPNPFKEKIGKGQLDEETIQKLRANLNELGMMGSLPIVQINKKYHLVYGHHRVEALKREFGKDHQIDVRLHDYNKDQLLRGMVIENLTQRYNEFHQELDNLLAIKERLSHIVTCPISGQVSHIVKGKQGFQPENGSTRDISKWLDKETETVMKKSKIADILKIAENLDEELLDNVKKQSHAPGEKDEEDETIGVKVATALASFEDKQEQKDLAKAIKQSREQHGNQVTKNLTFYKNTPDEIKQKVRQGIIDLADVEFESEKQELIEEADKRPTTIFIPNFAERLREFRKDVRHLEKQVQAFSSVFHSQQFKEKYHSLKAKDKGDLNVFISSMQERIKKCYDEVEFFMQQIPDDGVLLEVLV